MGWLAVAFVIFIIHVAAPEPLGLHRRVKRSADTCNCTQKVDCDPKFQIFFGHTACIPPSPEASPVAITGAMKQAIVDLHNQKRRQVTPVATNMLKMTWDDEVAMIAQRWTDACLVDSQGRTFHDPVRFIPGRFSVGQNLGVSHNSFTDVINAWYQEKTDYSSLFGVSISSFDPNIPIGHYTQMVWADSHKIGCGLTVCTFGTFYACNYAPAGNFLPFSSPYQTGSACSDCKTCVNGLCDCGGLVCENGGTLDTKTCTCSCSPPHSAPRCQLDCAVDDPSYCGTGAGFKAEDCHLLFVSSACPRLCGLCPCAEPDFDISQCSQAVLTPASVALVFNALLFLVVHRASPWA